MEALHLAHLILVSAWGGLVLAEVVVEAVADARAAALTHYFIDLFGELPLLAGVLATGGVLVWRAWPLTPLHWLKVAAGLVAIAANLVCAVLVIARRRAVDDPAALARWGRRVWWTGAGVPFGVVAAYVGLRYFV
jgi:hypothetical protein